MQSKGYNFTNINGLLINKQVWAYPINMDTIQQVLDNDTANPLNELVKCNMQHQLFYIQKHVRLF
ncbi:hypothetical protein [Spiroplasma endosymbiont of Polydrusus pterygomalis]|uniref:hypothetical protein n=1 Tax=Spiroplasma endosymbiont of Polydrusus pterygomalis TaxID=3139327 RepID=UPI003CCAB02B